MRAASASQSKPALLELQVSSFRSACHPCQALHASNSSHLHQGGRADIKDAHSSIVKAAGELVLQRVVAAAHDHLARGVKLVQLLVGVTVPDADCAI